MKAASSDRSTPPAADSKERFSSRVDNYVKYRPGYPPGVLQTLRSEYGLSPGQVVADIGAGTGISTGLFLDNGNTVYAVEPNPDMRAAAEKSHGATRGYFSIAGSGEATTLPDGSVDVVFCAQAFHWLDRTAAAREFKRIAKPEGLVAIVWNERKRTGSPFLAAYEAFLGAYGTDYKSISVRETSADEFTQLFGRLFKRFAFGNVQRFDYEGLLGRILSSSYVPLPGSDRYESMTAALPGLFGQFAVDGVVDFEYETETFVARMRRARANAAVMNQ